MKEVKIFRDLTDSEIEQIFIQHELNGELAYLLKKPEYMVCDHFTFKNGVLVEINQPKSGHFMNDMQMKYPEKYFTKDYDRLSQYLKANASLTR